MGASISHLYSQLPAAPRFRTSSTAEATTTAIAASPHRTQKPITKPMAPPTTKPSSSPTHSVVPPVSESIHEAEFEMIKHLTPSSFEYEKRIIPIRLSSSSALVNMNVLSAGSKDSPHLFLLPGWGAGAAFYSRNLKGLSENFRIHVIDWPGFGASSRPKYDIKWDVKQSESFFLDVLEVLLLNEFEKYEETFHPDKQKLSIAAHSLGAYLSVDFALRHPNKVNTLILISPVGIPQKPKTTMPSNSSYMKKLIFQLIFHVWDLGYTPQSLLRFFPKHIGMLLAKLMISSRLVVENNISATNSIINYFYQISIAPCSAELSLSTILGSGAYAKNPLCNRLHLLNLSNLIFLFGDRDWINTDPAKEACQKIGSINPDINAQVVVTPNAGHHLYFDNAHFFNQIVRENCCYS